MVGRKKLQLELKALNLPSGDAMSKSDPFMVIFQITKSGAFHYLARTEVIRNTLNPEWNILEIDVDHLYPPEQPEKKRESILRLEVMDDDGEGKVDPLVAGVYRLDQLMLAMESSRELALQDGRDASKRHEKAAIKVTKCCFVNQSDPPPPPAAAGSDEPIMNGSNESVFMTRGMSTESNVTLPRQSSNL